MFVQRDISAAIDRTTLHLLFMSGDCGLWIRLRHGSRGSRKCDGHTHCVWKDKMDLAVDFDVPERTDIIGTQFRTTSGPYHA
eukprot:SAG31_NODE_1700_length_7499_cov_2.107973_3_plen_82_part_00